MAYRQPFQITGFHSCDRELGMRLLDGSNELRPSDNPLDWLGPGIYFWERNPQRALAYAIEASQRQQKFSGKIKTAYSELRKTMQDSGEKMPMNKGANRQLDCAVIKYVYQSNNKLKVPAYDTIRSPFQEGGPIYEGANFTGRLHIEICVLNSVLIKGYFLPRPVEEFNPYLNKAFEG